MKAPSIAFLVLLLPLMGSGSAGSTPVVAPASERSNLQSSIAERMAEERRELEALQATAETTSDPIKLERLQGAIRDVKINTELAILELQRDHARRLQLRDAETRLTKAIDSLRNQRDSAKAMTPRGREDRR